MEFRQENKDRDHNGLEGNHETRQREKEQKPDNVHMVIFVAACAEVTPNARTHAHTMANSILNLFIIFSSTLLNW